MGQGPFLRVAGGVGTTSIALSSSEPSSASGSLFECCCDLNIFLTTTCRGGGGGGVSCRLYLLLAVGVELADFYPGLCSGYKRGTVCHRSCTT